MAEFVAVLVATVVSKFHGGEWKSTLNLLLVLKHLLLVYEALIAYFAYLRYMTYITYITHITHIHWIHALDAYIH